MKGCCCKVALMSAAKQRGGAVQSNTHATAAKVYRHGKPPANPPWSPGRNQRRGKGKVCWWEGRGREGNNAVQAAKELIIQRRLPSPTPSNRMRMGRRHALNVRKRMAAHVVRRERSRSVVKEVQKGKNAKGKVKVWQVWWKGKVKVKAGEVSKYNKVTYK